MISTQNLEGQIMFQVEERMQRQGNYKPMMGSRDYRTFHMHPKFLTSQKNVRKCDRQEGDCSGPGLKKKKCLYFTWKKK